MNPSRRVVIDKYGGISVVERGSAQAANADKTQQTKTRFSTKLNTHNIVRSSNISNDISKNISKNNNTSLFKHSKTSLLFNKATELANKKRHFIHSQSSLQTKREMKECTFKPKINRSLSKPFNNTFSKSRPKSQLQLPVTQVTVDDIKPLKKTLSREKIDEIANRLYSAGQRYEQLKSKERETYYKNVYTFHPEITNKEKPQVNNFFKRLQNWCYKSYENQIKLTEDAQYDSKSKQRLFSPQINKSSVYLTQTSQSSLNKSNSLYLLSTVNNKKASARLASKELEVKLNANKKKIDKRSETIYWEKVAKVFKTAFAKLAKQGKIDGKALDHLAKTKNIKGIFKEVLSSMLSQLKEESLEMEEEEFVSAGKSVFKVRM